MKYDPIMCMMVDDSVKTEDSNTLYETFAHGKSKHAGVLEMNGKVKVVVWNEGENPRTGKVTVIGEDTPSNRSKAKSMLDSASALDHAIRSCDEQIRLVKTISKKNGYAIHIVEGGYGERIVLTFPNESYANPHMWLGSNNSSNIQKAKELLDEFSK